MAGITTAACCSGLLFRNREGGGSGASLAQYNGLKVMETMQLASTGTKPNGFISSSGIWLPVIEFYWFLGKYTYSLAGSITKPGDHGTIMLVFFKKRKRKE